MIDKAQHDAWQAGDSYDQYLGRWSRQIASAFLEGRDMARDAGLASIEITTIERSSIFKDFGDDRHPFTLRAGPAPGYCKSLPVDARERLRAELAETLPRKPDGSIHFMTRALAMQAEVGRSRAARLHVRH